MYPFDRFSESAKVVLTTAQFEAEATGSSYIGAEHLLLGLMLVPGSISQQTLVILGFEEASVRDRVAQLRQSGKPVRIQQLIPTSKVKQVIEKAFEAAAEEQSPVVDTGHMLIGLFATDDPIASPVLAEKGATRERAKGALARLRQQGVSDAVKADVTGSPTRRHLALTDRRGRPIGIEIVFPAGYSSEDQDTLALRIHEAVGKGGTE